MSQQEKEIDGQDLKEALEAAQVCLKKHIEEVNILNVFPVPDGDTGINMFLTMKAAVEATKKSEAADLSSVSTAAARGALLGARGNSGVILSQILRGIARGIGERKRFSSIDFANALHIASEQAYKVMANPVEGTMLTVIREASEAASRTAQMGADFKRTISSVVSQAKETVKKTPDMLPVLKEAGVVDAGAKGLYYVFKGMKSAIHKKRFKAEIVEENPKVSSPRQKDRVYGFDVQFIIQGENLPFEEIRNRVNASGECPLVIGDESLIRVHVHTQNPDDILNYARSKGTLQDILIEDMDQQVQEKIEKESNRK